MNAFIGLGWLLGIVTTLVGIIVSVLTNDWTWFSRTGAVLTAEAIYLFAFFEQRFAQHQREAAQLFNQMSGATKPEDEMSEKLLEFIRSKGLDAPVKKDPKEQWEIFQRGQAILRVNAIGLEKALAIWGTLVWGFGDLPPHVANWLWSTILALLTFAKTQT